MAEASSIGLSSAVPQFRLPDAADRPWPAGIVILPLRPATRRRLGGGPLNVLLVEDDTAIADMYRVQLEYDGYNVTVVRTGEAALNAMNGPRPDIILLDLLLPDRGGLEVMLELKQSVPEHPPVVILSNYGEPAMIERGVALGAVEYLVKSRVTPDIVSRSIPEWVERGRSQPPKLH